MIFTFLICPTCAACPAYLYHPSWFCHPETLNSRNHDGDRPCIVLPFLFALPFSWVQMCPLVCHSQTPIQIDSILLHVVIHMFVERYSSVQTVCYVAAYSPCMSWRVAWFAIFSNAEKQTAEELLLLGTVPSVRSAYWNFVVRPSVRPSVGTRETTLEMLKGFYEMLCWRVILNLSNCAIFLYLHRTTVPDAFHHGQFIRQTLHMTGRSRGQHFACVCECVSLCVSQSEKCFWWNFRRRTKPSLYVRCISDRSETCTSCPVHFLR